MPPTIRLLPVFLLAAITLTVPAQKIPLHRTRTSPTDLEIGGDLTGIAHGDTRFVRYADLARLPQENVIARGDANFGKPVSVGGILLERLPALLGASPEATMITALCDDRYKSNYPPDYLQAHHPILILRINGRPPTLWPKSIDGPYIISHASFSPTFHVLSHADEPQIPWGVQRLDFRREADVSAGIQPLKPGEIVQQGFTIARQNCFRCHNQGTEGGTKAGKSWQVIARDAVNAPDFFDTYVRDPKGVNPASHMDPTPGYDEATLAALRTYLQPFAEAGKNDRR